MKSQAYFEKIHLQIEYRLKNASKSIRIAVAWFTDPKLFKIICDKAGNGLTVELLIAAHELNEGKLEYSKLKDAGGEFFWIGQGRRWEPLMHNKFCIVDNEVLIFGSYNWTKKAKSNHESITVIEDDFSLISDFNKEYEKIKSKYCEVENPNKVEWTKLLLRIDTLINAIKLDDQEDVDYQLKKTKKLIDFNSSDNNINKLIDAISYLEQNKFSDAIKLLDNIKSDFQGIRVYTDPKISALQLEIKSLEIQISSLEDEKTEIEKLVRTFDIKYNKELGSIINEILRLKMLKAKNSFHFSDDYKNEYRNRQKDYKDFNSSYNEKKNLSLPKSLDNNLQKTLKENYRKATKLCHPDMVAHRQKELAQKIFNDLRKAYENNNLEKVNRILIDLENGIFQSRDKQITQVEKLKFIKEELVKKRKDFEEDLNFLKTSDVYVKIKDLENWDEYFDKQKKDLQKVLDDLKEETSNL